MIEFSWDIHHSCNYRCPYCWFYVKWASIKKNNMYLGLDRLLHIWQSIHGRYGCVQIQITGGEPFTYPNFIELIAGISKIHKVCITTNLSGDIKGFVSKVDRSNVTVGMSFHPVYANPDNFLENAEIIKESGMGSNIFFLAWPPQIQNLLHYKEMFQTAGFNFSVLTFWGKYEDKDYPQSYTDQERRLINVALGARQESGDKFQLSPKVTRGKLCRAGQTYALIHPNGNVYRCGGGNWKVQHKPFSNLFNEDFSLFPEPLPCESEECPCNEWSFLLVDN